MSYLARSLIPLLLLTILTVSSIILHASEPVTDRSRLGQWVELINQQNAAVREDFARVAIEEVVMSLQLESELAALQSQAPQQYDRWSSATRNYARQLRLAAQTLTEESQVSLSVGMEGTVMIYLNEQIVVLGNPRIEDQAQMEARIIERFCRAQPCHSWQSAGTLMAPLSTARQLPMWTFRDGGNYSCNNGLGLTLEFTNIDGMAANKLLCQQFFDELYQLLIALRAQVSDGQAIDWVLFNVEQIPGDDHHRVRLDSEANDIWLKLPVCSSRTRLFDQVKPWLKSRTQGQASDLIVEQVDQLM